MGKSRFAICIILVFSMLFSIIIFADDEVLTPTVSLSADKSDIVGSGTVNLQIKVSDVTDVIKSGTVVLNKTDSTLATFGEMTSEDDIDWTNDGSAFSFTVTTPRTFSDGEVIAEIPITIGSVTQAQTLTLGSIASVTMKSADDADVIVTAGTQDVTVNLSPEIQVATDKKITLVSKISDIGDVAVKFTAGTSEIATTLELSEDGKEIYVTPSEALTDGTEYTVNVTGKGYTTSSSTKFTPNNGAYTFNVTDFLPGDFDGNNKVDFEDFVLVSLAYYNNNTYSDDTAKYDVNKDKAINASDVNAAILSWAKGGMN